MKRAIFDVKRSIQAHSGKKATMQMSKFAIRVEFLREDSWVKAVSVLGPTALSGLTPNKVGNALVKSLAVHPEPHQGFAR